MDRRTLLTLAAAGAFVTPAFAQTAMAPAGAMGEAEKNHATRTGMVGTASLMAANLGLEKATNGRVKQFARFEHDEQTTVAEILMSMDPSMKPMADPKMAPTLDRLAKMSAGKAFDEAFVQAQIEGHEELLTIQEDYLKVGRDRETVNATKLVRGQVKEHLALLNDLKSAI